MCVCVRVREGPSLADLSKHSRRDRIDTAINAWKGKDFAVTLEASGFHRHTSLRTVSVEVCLCWSATLIIITRVPIRLTAGKDVFSHQPARRPL